MAQRDAFSATCSYAPIGVMLRWLHLELHTCSGSMWASILVDGGLSGDCQTRDGEGIQLLHGQRSESQVVSCLSLSQLAVPLSHGITEVTRCNMNLIMKHGLL